MDCSRAKQAIYLCFDEEIDPETRAHFEEHLALCSPCSRHRDLTQKWLLVVRRRTIRLCAPASLRERILTSLARFEEARSPG
jgi:mycothiol system anti-sigma-R factor